MAQTAVEITSAYIDKSDRVIRIEGIDTEHWIEFGREQEDDLEERVQIFEFPMADKKAVTYLRRWLRDQKRVKELSKPTWGEVLSAVVGTYTTISNRYKHNPWW